MKCISTRYEKRLKSFEKLPSHCNSVCVSFFCKLLFLLLFHNKKGPNKCCWIIMYNNYPHPKFFLGHLETVLLLPLTPPPPPASLSLLLLFQVLTS